MDNINNLGEIRVEKQNTEQPKPYKYTVNHVEWGLLSFAVPRAAIDGLQMSSVTVWTDRYYQFYF